MIQMRSSMRLDTAAVFPHAHGQSPFESSRHQLMKGSNESDL